ncbi:ABC transporter permease [Methylobacillus flagellatus]|uniref:ABC transporter permease n=1 Tax=Methylobacillus flagellatus TaxID=405 RepID=UPI0010F62A45|nr:ABC transporter permease [Methylobacillus flagellatus]
MTTITNPIDPSKRSALKVTWSVWRALFLRESSANLSEGRIPWFWIIFEPLSHVLVWLMIHAYLNIRFVPGVDVVTFFVSGLLGMIMFREVVINGMNAVTAYAGLLSYRQIKPVDCVIIRAFFRGFVIMMAGTIFLVVIGSMGRQALPNAPLIVFLAYCLIWAFGLGLGLIFSVGARFIPKLQNIVTVVLRIMYFTSGAIIPITYIPNPARDYMMMNPVAHGFETIHAGFFSAYPPAQGTSLLYLAAGAIIVIFVGLFLQYHMAHRLISK